MNLVKPDMFGDKMTLEDSREWVMEQRAVGKGVKCPCCDQTAAIYSRKIHHSMVTLLVEAVRITDKNGNRVFFSTDELAHLSGMGDFRSGDWAKLRYWGLVERNELMSGFWWRVTNKGRKFVYEGLKVPSTIRLYNNELIGMIGDMVSIQECKEYKPTRQELIEDLYD